jgi:hypothetical protein
MLFTIVQLGNIYIRNLYNALWQRLSISFVFLLNSKKFSRLVWHLGNVFFAYATVSFS